MRNKLFITLALVCALGFGSSSIANAQCGGMSSGGKKHARSGSSKSRHARRHARRAARKSSANSNANSH